MGARTSRGSVTAPKVILGVNGLVQAFGQFRGRLMHVFTYASMTAAFTAEVGRDRWGFLPADPMGSTVRKITGPEGSRIAIRTRYTYDPSVQVSERRVARIAASTAARLTHVFLTSPDIPSTIAGPAASA